jgi:hypothetical protein
MKVAKVSKELNHGHQWFKTVGTLQLQGCLRACLESRELRVCRYWLIKGKKGDLQSNIGSESKFTVRKGLTSSSWSCQPELGGSLFAILREVTMINVALPAEGSPRNETWYFLLLILPTLFMLPSSHSPHHLEVSRIYYVLVFHFAIEEIYACGF